MTKQTGKEIDVFIYRQSVIEVFAQPLRHPGDFGANIPAVTRIAHIATEHHHVTLFNDPRTGNQRQ